MPNRHRSLALAAPALLLAASVAAADRPQLGGTWRLQPGASDDIEARVAAWAGPEKTVGHGGDPISVGERNTDEVDRIALRKLLLDRAQFMKDVEIALDDREFKIVDGDIGVRIFYFGRKHTRQTPEGITLACQTRWDGDKLVVDEKGKDVHVVEVFTVVPDGSRLTRSIHLEHDLRKGPLELRMLYDRVPAPGGGS
ncbi:MAG TPA: hypothetical protein VII13_11145 [Vicinamibacteria bacterium]|jgi:hypothetical protein